MFPRMQDFSEIYLSLYSRTACKCQNIITSIMGRRLLENIMNNRILSMTGSGLASQCYSEDISGFEGSFKLEYN